jgi:geranylgeranyl diphosphate synthase type I
MTVSAAIQSGLGAEAALATYAAELERTLGAQLTLADEAQFDPRWTEALEVLRAFGLRPAKRVRPTLLALGWGLASGAIGGGVPPGVRAFAAGLELLHLFMLVHDDVADRGASRRGGPALHRLLGEGKVADDLAVVLGDHLYARAVEAMLDSGLPGAPSATRYMMGICRHTAAGQFLDLQLAQAPLSEVTVFQALRVAHLKTARYGFQAPLVVGALLGGGSLGLKAQLERVGRHLGLAYQLQDDLLGLFGDDAQTGKSGGGDFFEGKRSFPVLAAWTRADQPGREALAALWAHPARGPDELAQARALLERLGGRAATERVVARATRSAQRVMAGLPPAAGVRAALQGLAFALQGRRR